MSKTPTASRKRAPAKSWTEPVETRVTRAMNLNLAEQDVIDRCHREAIAISAIETLLSGGTHLVCVTIEGADEARHLFRQDVNLGPVRRASFQRVDTSRLR
jgi:hypothetical protein